MENTKQIIDALTNNGETQASIAKKCGVSQSRISRIFTGATKIVDIGLHIKLASIIEKSRKKK